MTGSFDPIALMADAMRLAGVSERGLDNAQLDRLRAPVRLAWFGAAAVGLFCLLWSVLAMGQGL